MKMSGKQENENPIDIVILWVDDQDPEWRKQKERYYALTPKEGGVVTAPSSRYRNWGLIKYIFRGIENYAPWVDKVFLVTNGQQPDWLNPKADGFRLVRHEEFLKAENLPTFSSQAIDLNLWRIPDLSEHFIYLNDDMFFTRPVLPEDFFHDGLPLDVFSERPVFSGNPVFQCNLLNIVCALSRHYRRRDVLRRNRRKILNLKYGSLFFYNLIWYAMPFQKFCGLYMHHLPTSYRKSQMERVYRQNADVCDRTCTHRFRTINDVNQFIFNYDALLSGEFYPASMQKEGRRMDITGDNTQEICEIIESGRWKRLCLNDECEDDGKAEQAAALIQRSFEKLFPAKSRFEL